MVHQDQQLRDLVTRLKAAGEWENTLLVIGADHGHPAGSFARWGRGLFEPQPAPWEGALFDAYAACFDKALVDWMTGVEGQTVRVRIGDNHVAAGRPTGPNLIEVGL